MSSIFDVCIIGAGFSGLAAARKLHNSSKEARICILEARDRIGGRIHTLRVPDEHPDSIDDAHVQYTVDIGGQWVGPGQHRILQLISKFKLELVEQEYNSTSSSPTSRLNNVASYEFPPFNDHEQQQVLHFFDHVDKLGEQMDCKAPWDIDNATYYDSYSLHDYVTMKLSSDKARREVLLFAQTVLACDPTQCSFLFFIFYVASGGGFDSLGDGDQGAQKWKLKNGAQSVAECMLQELQSSDNFSLFCNTPISAIEYSPASSHPITVTSCDRTFSCKYIIVAISPALATKHITFTPALPTQKYELANAMVPGTCIKVIVAYKDAFWNNRAAGETCLYVEELGPVHNIFTSTVGSFPALVCLLTGAAAQQQSRLSPAERRNSILRQLERMYGPRGCGIDIMSPKVYVERDWSQEQFSGGCFANSFLPGCFSKFGPELRTANWEMRMQWASTETSDCFYGYMEGALNAGESAANSILDNFLNYLNK